MTYNQEPGHLPSLKDLTGLDSDGDGIPDAVELAIGTDPYSSDTDRDGISDGEEYARTHTNPRDKDTDHDGVSDRDELRSGRDPRHADDRYLDREGVASIASTASLILIGTQTSELIGENYQLRSEGSDLWISSPNRGDLLHWNGVSASLNHLTPGDLNHFSELQKTLEQDSQQPLINSSEAAYRLEMD